VTDDVSRLLLHMDGSKRVPNDAKLLSIHASPCLGTAAVMADCPSFTCWAAGSQGSYLVDPASSHMLVSKIKPCMSKYKLLIL
jgi:coenzyme F420-reducing hydrogenase gamma subunit